MKDIIIIDLGEKSIDELSSVYHNGQEVAETIDLSSCVSFWPYNSQETLIYDLVDIERKHIKYSCNVTEICNKPVILSIYDKDGMVYESNYNKLYDEIEIIMKTKNKRIKQVCM